MKKTSPFIPQMEPTYGAEEKRAVAEYLDSGGWLMEFKKTEEFERAICAYTGARYCSVVSNGTITLVLALLAVGVRPGDEVIVPDYTMIATPNAVRMIGATPAFVDVDESMCLDPKLVASAISRKTKAVMHVSVNGRVGRLDALRKICRARHIPLIEDAAQSLGSWYQRKHVGRHGAIGSFSFSVPKIITTGQGGALITDDRALYEKIEKLKDFGRVRAGVDEHDQIGWNFKFTDLQAVFGLAQMKKLPWRVARKKKMFALYKKELARVHEVSFIPTSASVAPWFMDILVPDPKALAAHLKERGIGSRPFYPAIHTQAVYADARVSCPNALRFGAHGLWLPSSSAVTDAQIRKICRAIRDFYQPRK